MAASVTDRPATTTSSTEGGRWFTANGAVVNATAEFVSATDASGDVVAALAAGQFDWQRDATGAANGIIETNPGHLPKGQQREVLATGESCMVNPANSLELTENNEPVLPMKSNSVNARAIAQLNVAGFDEALYVIAGKQGDQTEMAIVDQDGRTVQPMSEYGEYGIGKGANSGGGDLFSVTRNKDGTLGILSESVSVDVITQPVQRPEARITIHPREQLADAFSPLVGQDVVYQSGGEQLRAKIHEINWPEDSSGPIARIIEENSDASKQVKMKTIALTELLSIPGNEDLTPPLSAQLLVHATDQLSYRQEDGKTILYDNLCLTPTPGPQSGLYGLLYSDSLTGDTHMLPSLDLDLVNQSNPGLLQKMLTTYMDRLMHSDHDLLLEAYRFYHHGIRVPEERLNIIDQLNNGSQQTDVLVKPRKSRMAKIGRLASQAFSALKPTS